MVKLCRNQTVSPHAYRRAAPIISFLSFLWAASAVRRFNNALARSRAKGHGLNRGHRYVGLLPPVICRDTGILLPLRSRADSIIISCP